MSKTVEELEKDVVAMAELLNQFIPMLINQDKQIKQVIGMFNEFINKKGKVKEDGNK